MRAFNKIVAVCVVFSSLFIVAPYSVAVPTPVTCCVKWKAIPTGQCTGPYVMIFIQSVNRTSSPSDCSSAITNSNVQGVNNLYTGYYGYSSINSVSGLCGNLSNSQDLQNQIKNQLGPQITQICSNPTYSFSN